MSSECGRLESSFKLMGQLTFCPDKVQFGTPLPNPAHLVISELTGSILLQSEGILIYRSFSSLLHHPRLIDIVYMPSITSY